MLQACLEGLGLHIYTTAATHSITGNGRAQAVQLTTGRAISGELVLISTGMRSCIQLGRDAGLEVNRGVVVDDHLGTSAPDVFAAGDVAEYGGTVYGIIPAAIEQAQAAAANMVNGDTTLYRGTTLATTLKVVGIDLTCLGDSTADGPEYRILRYSDQATGVYKRLALHNDKIVGAILLGDVEDGRWFRTLISQGRNVVGFGSRLLDGGTDLKALASGQQPA